MAVLLEQELIEILQTEAGMSELDAARHAPVLVRGLRKRFGGSRLGSRGLYIPAPDRSERDASIRREFTGTNLEELMLKYKLSRPRIYQIVAKGRLPRPIEPLFESEK